MNRMIGNAVRSCVDKSSSLLAAGFRIEADAAVRHFAVRLSWDVVLERAIEQCRRRIETLEAELASRAGRGVTGDPLEYPDVERFRDPTCVAWTVVDGTCAVADEAVVDTPVMVRDWRWAAVWERIDDVITDWEASGDACDGSEAVAALDLSAIACSVGVPSVWGSQWRYPVRRAGVIQAWCHEQGWPADVVRQGEFLRLLLPWSAGVSLDRGFEQVLQVVQDRCAVGDVCNES